MDILKKLEQEDTIYGPCHICRLLLVHGVVWPGYPFNSKIYGSRGRSGRCFANAQRLAIKHNLVYCAGVAYSDDDGRLLPHGWCLDDDGYVIDPTWRPAAGHYLGIPFKKGSARVLRGMEVDGLFDYNGPKGSILTLHHPDLSLTRFTIETMYPEWDWGLGVQ